MEAAKPYKIPKKSKRPKQNKTRLIATMSNKSLAEAHDAAFRHRKRCIVGLRNI